MTTINFITPCSRPKNLPILKESIQKARDKGKHNVLWHICFDFNAIQTSSMYEQEDLFKEDWIKIYVAGTFKNNPGKAQINFVLTHFKSGLFYGFIYVLDDDNIIPEDFLEYNYDSNESLIYLFPQIYNENQIRSICPLADKIDQGQILVYSSIQIFYPLSYNADGVVIEQLCKNYPYKEMDNFTYYNKLT